MGGGELQRRTFKAVALWPVAAGSGRAAAPRVPSIIIAIPGDVLWEGAASAAAAAAVDGARVGLLRQVAASADSRAGTAAFGSAAAIRGKSTPLPFVASESETSI